jgi:hypothetical protein
MLSFMQQRTTPYPLLEESNKTHGVVLRMREMMNRRFPLFSDLVPETNGACCGHAT